MIKQSSKTSVLYAVAGFVVGLLLFCYCLSCSVRTEAFSGATGFLFHSIDIANTNKSSDNTNTAKNGYLASSSLAKKLSCVRYDISNKAINICGGAVSLTQINSVLKNPSVLNQTSKKNWFLNANVNIGNKATLFVNSSDTDWLKINSTAGSAYSIVVKGDGKLVIDHTKITSWNSTSNTVAKLKTGKEPRSYLVVSGSGGQMNITNSDLSYLGYVTFNQAGGERGYTNGIAYYSGNGSVIKNNTISYNYRGFYSAAISNITVENNSVFNNFEYGLDPHTGSSDLKIYNNTVYGNGDHGIICSEHCDHIIVENNTVYNNKGHGIDLDLFVRNSIVQNNIVYHNKYSGVGVWTSRNNLIDNNKIYNNSFGIIVTQGSYGNLLKENLINSSRSYGVYLYANSSQNKFERNTILNSNSNQIYIQDNNTRDNMFINNNIKSGLSNGIQFYNSSGNVFIKNVLDDNMGYNYYSKAGSTNIIKDTPFYDTTLRFFDNSSNYIIQQTDHRIINNDKKIPNIVYPNNVTVFLKPINKNITLTSLNMTVIPSSHYTKISTFNNDFNINEKHKKWTEVSPNPSIKTKYTLGGFQVNTPIMVNMNGSLWNVYTSDSSGRVSFIYDGGKTIRPFDLQANSMPIFTSAAVLVLIVIGLALIYIIRRKKKREEKTRSIL